MQRKKDRSLSSIISDLRNYDADVERLTQAARKKRGRLHAKTVERLKTGESTGDQVEDYMLIHASSGAPGLLDDIRKRLTKIRDGLVGKSGEYVLLVETQSRPDFLGGRFRPASMRASIQAISTTLSQRSYSLGKIASDRLLISFGAIELDDAGVGLSVEGYAHLPDGRPLSVYSVATARLALPTNLLIAANMFFEGGRKTTECLIGNNTIDTFMIRHCAQHQLDRMLRALGDSIESFPKCRAMMTDI